MTQRTAVQITSMNPAEMALCNTWRCLQVHAHLLPLYDVCTFDYILCLQGLKEKATVLQSSSTSSGLFFPVNHLCLLYSQTERTKLAESRGLYLGLNSFQELISGAGGGVR